ncbi:hypothetical protein BJ741DRAFT_664169 [Chytriomyces cf. hyalinus JEL632]|nr:hypothetical protein BJ741DRAFT_664169 [Chytriomyces cf. hyalinus JEL632]
MFSLTANLRKPSELGKSSAKNSALMPTSTYACVGITMTVLTSLHLAVFVIFINCLQEKQARSLSRTGLPTLFTSFNISIFTMIASLLTVFCAEIASTLVLDCNITMGKTVANILLISKAIGFMAITLGYISYSYGRAKGIFERTLDSVSSSREIPPGKRRLPF